MSSDDMPPPPIPTASSGIAAPPPAASVSAEDGGGTPARASQRARRPSTRLEQSGEGSGGGSYSLRDSLRGRKTAPRLKLNLKTAVQAGASVGTGPKTTPYMQGFDRELDSSDDETGEGLAFEEQLVLRMPPGEACEQLREWVRRREIGKQGAQVELKFKDSRRAVFKMGTQLFAAKLVDLPTILETHKTLDARQLFKIADVSQMLLVTHPIQSEAEATRAAPPPPLPDREGSAHINPDTAQTLPGAGEYVFDHGITPPMRFARKRRFRRRAHKRVIETVEKEIERLLADDRKAEKVEYEMIDSAQADFSDDNEQNGAGGSGATRRGHSTTETPAPGEDGASAMGDGASMDGEDHEAAGTGMEDDWDAEGAGEVDHDLAAELEAVMRGDALDEASDDAESSVGGSARGAGSGRATSEEGDGDLWGDEDGDESGGDDEEGEDEEDLDDEEKERRVREAQLEAQCREMEALVKRKQAEAGATTNALIKKRQLDALKRLVAERDMKTSQLADVRAERRQRAAEAAAVAAAATEPSGAPASNAAAEELAAPARPSEKGKEREVSSARSASSAVPSAHAVPAPSLALPVAAASSSTPGPVVQPMEVDEEVEGDADGDVRIFDADARGEGADDDEELWS